MNWGDSGQRLRKQGRRQGIPFVCALKRLSQETFSNKKVNWRWELDGSVMTPGDKMEVNQVKVQKGVNVRKN